MGKLAEKFGTMVFGDSAMRESLPKDVYRSLKQTISEGKDLDITLANAVAHAMKTWAIEKGATHYTHWFQPLNGVTAEKHESFLTPFEDGEVIEQFSGKKLIKGEPDASSFPSGGLRATFEARGYTAWDPTSYAFIKDKTLCIPTAFCSYGGEMLDKKTPLLRSIEALSEEATRVVRLMGLKDVTGVRAHVGAEQEYFLIDKALWQKREDLKICGRTLFGAPPPKGQELEDHYFGAIRPRVKAFMDDLDEELWRLGICAGIEHNEAAPAQHELAPVYTLCNIAADQNQLTMEIMKKTADRHGLVCLLHEKPFRGVNGSGKHNNWSLQTNTGLNLMKPGEEPSENVLFLLFLAAVIKSVDEYQDLLRVSVASPSNDLRLGGNEAPPAVISIYLGDELTAILENVAQGKKTASVKKAHMQTGVHVLPDFKKDTTDRNRTSPFAFTGNKFEFRMPGSGQSISDVNTVLNTAMAETLSGFADYLTGKKEVKAAALRLVKKVYNEHRRIIFNGNNYSPEWAKEASERGLCRYATAADAIPCLEAPKNAALFARRGVFSGAELRSRLGIMRENYTKVITIEAMTMLDMTRKLFLPAADAYASGLCREFASFENCSLQAPLLKNDVENAVCMTEKIRNSEKGLLEARRCLENARSESDAARICRDRLLPAMDELRTAVDEAERVCPASLWPVPTYSELLFSV